MGVWVVHLSRCAHKDFIDHRVPAHLNKKEEKNNIWGTENGLKLVSSDNATTEKASLSVAHTSMNYVCMHLMDFIAEFWS